MSDKIEKQAVIQKLGGLSRTMKPLKEYAELSGSLKWDTRILVLTKTELKWFSTTGQKAPQKSLSLKDIKRIIKIAGRYLERSFCIKIYSENKYFLFAFDTPQDQQDWANLINDFSGIQIESVISEV